MNIRPLPQTAALFLLTPINDEDTQVDYVPVTDEVDTIKHDEVCPGLDKPLTYIQVASPVLSFRVVDDDQ